LSVKRIQKKRQDAELGQRDRGPGAKVGLEVERERHSLDWKIGFERKKTTVTSGGKKSGLGDRIRIGWERSRTQFGRLNLTKN